MSFTPGAGTRFLVSTGASGTTPLSGPLSITGGTVTANNPVLSATQTWNNAAVTFTGWQLNVTDTASNASSLLMDFQVGGVGVFAVDKTGALLSRIGSANAFGTFIIRPYSTASFEVWVGNNRSFQINSGTGVRLSSGFPLSWTNGVDVNNTIDLSILRDAANTLAQRNGVDAQTFRVYNTFTDASNYERGRFAWVSNSLVIGTENAGTGSTRNIKFQTNGTSRWILDVAGHWLTEIDNTYDIGAAGSNRPRNFFSTGYQQMSEMTAPAAPAANEVRIYAVDNGSGKTQLMALFATGAAQQIAIEP